MYKHDLQHFSISLNTYNIKYGNNREKMAENQPSSSTSLHSAQREGGIRDQWRQTDFFSLS